MIDMPVCEHRVPVKEHCWHCKQSKKTESATNTLEMFDLQRKIKDHRLYIDNLDEKVNELDNDFGDLDRQIDDLADQIDEIKTLINRMNAIFGNINRIESDAQTALDLFIRKAHDLKKIDAKRDDVINSLCQKIMQLEERLNHANPR